MSIAESKRESVGAIFLGNRFIIPTYQRKYSWKNKERKELWDDIREAMKNDINHFFGTLIFKKIDDDFSLNEVYEIIDGQQRTTSLFLLLSELISKVADQKIKTKLFEAYIAEDDSLKLQLLGNDESFLKKLIFDFSSIEANSITKRSQKNLYEAKRFFADILSSYTQEEISSIIIFIRKRIEVLVLVVQQQSEAIRMFEIINDRGLELSYLDKIKSILMLYSTMYLQDSLNQTINTEFEKIFDANDDIMLHKAKLKILNRFDENETLFTHHYFSNRTHLSSTWNYRNGAKTIYESIKNRCEELKNNKEDLELFVKNYIEDFANFASSHAMLVKEIPQNKKYVEAFQFLEFSATLYPLVVLLYQQNKLDELLETLISVELRVYKFKGTNPRADIPLICSDIAVNHKETQEIDEILKSFMTKFMNDGNFKYGLDDNIYGNNAVKYLLFKYNQSLYPGFMITFEEYDALQVEHIFPSGGDRGVSFDVLAYGFENSEDYSFKIGTLGNLALLEKTLNAGKEVSNLTPKEKTNGYLKSNIPETSSLASILDKNEFTKEALQKRGKKIIEFCVKEF